MRYHQRADQVGLAVAVTDLKSALLAARQGANRPLPADVNALRRDISGDAMTPCAHILRVLLTDIAQGVALDRCLEFPRRLVMILSTAARVRDGAPVLSVDAALDLEVPVDLELDGLQWAIRCGDHSRPTLLRAHAVCRAHAEKLNGIAVSIEHELYGAAA
jgi:hypothetical protein